MHALVPGDEATVGLLALMLLQHARAPARAGEDGGVIPYSEQDASR